MSFVHMADFFLCHIHQFGDKFSELSRGNLPIDGLIYISHIYINKGALGVFWGLETAGEFKGPACVDSVLILHRSSGIICSQTLRVTRCFLGVVFVLLVLNSSSLVFLDTSGFGEGNSKFIQYSSISNYFITSHNISSGGVL
jgi:hypothetical protein